MRNLDIKFPANPELTACGSGLVFCVCDACILRIAAEHAEGDIECGRAWLCTCAACTKARGINPTFEIDVRFARIERLQKRRDAVRAVAAMEADNE